MRKETRQHSNGNRTKYLGWMSQMNSVSISPSEFRAIFTKNQAGQLSVLVPSADGIHSAIGISMIILDIDRPVNLTLQAELNKRSIVP